MTLQNLIDYANKMNIPFNSEIVLTEIMKDGFGHNKIEIEGYVDDGNLKISLIQKCDVDR